jgi:pimeloyl-ACP methyl ester carboxylesterase
VKPRRSGFLAFGAVVGSLALAALARPAILRIGQNRPRFVYSCTPLPPAAYDALAARSGWNKTSMSVAPGISLKGLIRRPANHDAPWVLFFPGNDVSQLTNGQAVLERISAGRDWGLVVYAYRGFDSSDGTPAADTLRDDGYRILEDVVRREHLKPSQIHVVAFSLGGYVAFSAVGAAARANQKVRSLSTLAAVEDMEMIHSLWQGRLSIGDVIQSLPLLDAVPGPVLVLHGDADQTLDVEQGRMIAAALGERGRFRALPGVGHLAINENAEAIQAVRAMIEETSAH